MKIHARVWAVLLVGMAVGLTPLGADAGGGGFGGGGRGARGAGGAGGRGGGFQMNVRQMVEGRLQQSIGFSNDEWTVVEPKLWRVATLEMALGQGPMARITTMMQRFAARGNQGGTDPMAQLQTQEDPTVVQLSQQFQQAGQQLQTLINDQTASPEQIEVKLKEYRADRGKLTEALTAAQKDLQSVLTLRQEALLLLSDYIV